MVSLIEHGDLDGVQVQQALAHQVLQAPRRCHDNLHAIPECLNLAGLGHPTKNGGDPEVHGFC